FEVTGRFVIGVTPSKNVTEPPATSAPGGVNDTVAVSVTASPKRDGLGIAPSVVVVDLATVNALLVALAVLPFWSAAVTRMRACDETGAGTGHEKLPVLSRPEATGDHVLPLLVDDSIVIAPGLKPSASVAVQVIACELPTSQRS